MKRISLVLWLMLLLPAVPALAANSIEFSTPQGVDSSWQLANVGGTWQLTFVPNATTVGNSEPADAVLLNDSVNLPTMTLTNIAVPVPGILTATLTPVGDLTIQADAGEGGVSAGDTVLTTSVAAGGFITAGTNFIAYSDLRSDLDILSFADGYGEVIPLLVAADFPLNLSFSGESQVDLLSILTGTSLGATARGGLCGSIVTIPTPGALLLAVFGTTMAGWLRQRKLL